MITVCAGDLGVVIVGAVFVVIALIMAYNVPVNERWLHEPTTKKKLAQAEEWMPRGMDASEPSAND